MRDPPIAQPTRRRFQFAQPVETGMATGAPNMQRDTGVLIRRIYDAVDDVDALPDVLSGLCERIGGENGLLGILMKTPGPLPLRFSFALIPR